MDTCESANSILALPSPLPGSVKDPKTLARMVIRESKSFKESALACGYTQSIAGRGLKALIAESSVVAKAFEEETKSFITLEKLKPLAIRRLHDEIVNPKSSLGIKAIELAGRFKETDWYVRNAEVNIGVFAALGELGPTIDASASIIPDEEKP